MRMRLFLGLPVPAELAASLLKRARALNLPDVRWTPPENVHVTLVFLGNVAEEKLGSIVLQLAGLRSPPQQVRLTGLGTFPRAGVLFADVDPSRELLTLQQDVAERMIRCGFPSDPRPYHPHVTLGRFRLPVRVSAKLELSFCADVVNLYRSKTLPTGPQYEVIASAKAEV